MATDSPCVNYKGYQLYYCTSVDKLESGILEKFSFRTGDVVISGFPKSGNTWLIFLLQEMYQDWKLLEDGGKRVPPMIEMLSVDDNRSGKIWGPEMLSLIRKFQADPNATPSPRLFKSHLPYELFPKPIRSTGAKVIYVSRNPKDAVVSSYHWHGEFKATKNRQKQSWQNHLDDFIHGRLPFSPWENHVSGWRQHGVEENILHVTYENMVKDTNAVVRSIGAFLERPLSEDDVIRVVENTRIEKLRSNSTSAAKIDMDDSMMPDVASAYFRKGTVGDWKNHFTIADNEMFEETIGKRLREKGLEFTYE
ncbi:sulfotransferase 1 family member D1-like [Glandiceps talaboti]